jgi:hypothetical protein
MKKKKGKSSKEKTLTFWVGTKPNAFHASCVTVTFSRATLLHADVKLRIWDFFVVLNIISI